MKLYDYLEIATLKGLEGPDVEMFVTDREDIDNINRYKRKSNEIIRSETASNTYYEFDYEGKDYALRIGDEGDYVTINFKANESFAKNMLNDTGGLFKIFKFCIQDYKKLFKTSKLKIGFSGSTDDKKTKLIRSKIRDLMEKLYNDRDRYIKNPKEVDVELNLFKPKLPIEAKDFFIKNFKKNFNEKEMYTLMIKKFDSQALTSRDILYFDVLKKLGIIDSSIKRSQYAEKFKANELGDFIFTV